LEIPTFSGNKLSKLKIPGLGQFLVQLQRKNKVIFDINVVLPS